MSQVSVVVESLIDSAHDAWMEELAAAEGALVCLGVGVDAELWELLKLAWLRHDEIMHEMYVGAVKAAYYSGMNDERLALVRWGMVSANLGDILDG
jgi:hypothetical protein